jgi:glycosyltransferase involved in cell wall biosynthesis
MKICFVSYAPDPTTRRAYQLAELFEEFGFETKVLTFWEKAGPHPFSFPLNLPQLFNRFVRLTSRIIEHAPDVTYVLGSFPPHALAVIRSNKVLKNCLVFALDDWELKYDAIINRITLYCEKYLVRHSVATIAASKELMKHVSALGASNAYYVPVGVDTDLFDPKKFEKKEFEKKVLIFTGARTREYWDNILLLLRSVRIVAQKNKNFELWMIGNSQNQIDDFIRKISGKWSIPLRLEKAVRFELLPGLLAQADIALHPLVDNIFNRCKCPTKLFEYMSMELPVVSSKVGEASIVIRHRVNGLLCENEQEFADNILTLLNDENLARKIGKSARKTVKQKYSLRALSRRLADIVTKSCKTRADS